SARRGVGISPSLGERASDEKADPERVPVARARGASLHGPSRARGARARRAAADRRPHLRARARSVLSRVGSAEAGCEVRAVLDHVGIAVRDLAAALAFYRDALGLEVDSPENVESQR